MVTALLKRLMESSSSTENREQQENSSQPLDENTNIEPQIKKKRTRRVYINPTDPTEFQLNVNKFRKLNDETRFAMTENEGVRLREYQTTSSNIRKNCEETDYLHPATCLHSVMVDLDIAGEIDTKRNFKLFTYHVEHRYNTLMSDINFRLHFLVKDYIDEEYERIRNEESVVSTVYSGEWPPLSEAYVNKYVELETLILRQEIGNRCASDNTTTSDIDSAIECSDENCAIESDHQSNDKNECNESNLNIQDSGLGTSLEETQNISSENSIDNNNCSQETQNISNETNIFDTSEEINRSINSSGYRTMTDTLTSEIEQNINNFSPLTQELTSTQNGIENQVSEEATSVIQEEEVIDLNKMRFCLNDKIVMYEDIEKRTLTTTVVMQDLFPNFDIECKDDIVITIDDDIRQVFNVECDEEIEYIHQPKKFKTQDEIPILLNIMKFNHQLLKKRTIFKLGPDMDLFLEARSLKKARRTTPDTNEPRKLRSTNFFNEQYNPIENITLEDDEEEDGEDLCGFEGNLSNTLNKRLEFLKNLIDASKNPITIDDDDLDDDMSRIETIRDNPVVNDLIELPLSPLPLETNDDNTVANDISSPPSPFPIEPNIDNSLIAAINNDNNVCNIDAEVDDGLDTDEMQINVNNEEIEERLREIENNEIIIEKTNMQEWQDRLQPHLAHAKERHHFDIFAIGTEILDNVKTETEKCTNYKNYATFEDVMRDKDECNVSRYFLSSLLLINQNNLELTVNNQSSEHPSEWSDLQLKILSTQRHVVSIEDNIGLPQPEVRRQYTAPIPIPVPKPAPIPIQIPQEEEEFIYRPPERKVHRSSFENVTVNLEGIRPVVRMRKVDRNSDDLDSGVFSFSEDILGLQS